MGGCLTTEKFYTQPNQAGASIAEAGRGAGESQLAADKGETVPPTTEENMAEDSTDAKKSLGGTAENPSSASSVASAGRGASTTGAPPMPEGSLEKLVPSSEGSRDPASSPPEASVQQRESEDPTSGLTEQALKQVWRLCPCLRAS